MQETARTTMSGRAPIAGASVGATSDASSAAATITLSVILGIPARWSSGTAPWIASVRAPSTCTVAAPATSSGSAAPHGAGNGQDRDPAMVTSRSVARRRLEPAIPGIAGARAGSAGVPQAPASVAASTAGGSE